MSPRGLQSFPKIMLRFGLLNAHLAERCGGLFGNTTLLQARGGRPEGSRWGAGAAAAAASHASAAGPGSSTLPISAPRDIARTPAPPRSGPGPSTRCWP